MLKQRVVTALILFGAFVWTLSVQHSGPFAALTLALIAAAGWEWSRIAGRSGLVSWLMGAAAALSGVGLAWLAGLDGLHGPDVMVHGVHPHVHAPGVALVGFSVNPQIWWAVALLWVAGGAWTLRRGPVAWGSVPQGVRLILGVPVLAVGWLALFEARTLGVNFLLSMLCLVWAADIGAYFGGRTWGRRKLAPTISPGKSWEGVWSGFVAVLLVAGLWVWADRSLSVDSPSMYSYLLRGLGPVGASLSLAVLTAMSVVGDLFESLIKRQAGVKDSSQLLPGHGGVLDRIDALLPVLPIEMALMSLCHG